MMRIAAMWQEWKRCDAIKQHTTNQFFTYSTSPRNMRGRVEFHDLVVGEELR